MKTFDLTNINFNKVSNLTYDQSYLTRYTLMTELVIQAKSILKKEKEPLHILDLGGYNGLARKLMPQDRITILDTFEDEKLDDYIRVDKVGIPVEANTYDIVICSDVLEHIPNKERDTFIKEALRVSKHFVFIGAPFGDAGVEEEELYSNMLYKGGTNEEYVWLKEHHEFILPKKDWMERLIKQQSGVHFATFSHTTARLWGDLLRVGFFMANNIAEVNAPIAKRLKKLNNEYFKKITNIDFPESGYRRFYILSKSGSVRVQTPSYETSVINEFIATIHKEWGWAVAKSSHDYHVLNSGLQDAGKKIAELNRDVARLTDIERNYNEVISSRRYRVTEPIARIKAKILNNIRKK